MAKEKPESGERVYTIPLRRGWLNSPKNMRSNRAVNDIKRFISRHMKVDNVKISPKLNDAIWRKGDSKPPASVKVKVSIDEETATARLPDEMIIEKKKEESKGRLGGLKDKAKAIQSGKPVTDVVKSEPQKAEAKKDETEKEKDDKTKPDAGKDVDAVKKEKAAGDEKPKKQ